MTVGFASAREERLFRNGSSVSIPCQDANVLRLHRALPDLIVVKRVSCETQASISVDDLEPIPLHDLGANKVAADVRALPVDLALGPASVFEEIDSDGVRAPRQIDGALAATAAVQAVVVDDLLAAKIEVRSVVAARAESVGPSLLDAEVTCPLCHEAVPEAKARK